MQRKRLAICLMLCCLLAAAFLQRPGRAADAGSRGTLLILLDVSGSMSVNDDKYIARNWAQGLCAMCRSMGVDTEVILFSDQPRVQEKDHEGMPQLDNVTYGGNTTNHLGALVKAEEILRESASVGRCGIVMLSDGVLDLIGRQIDDVETPRDSNEEAAILKFLEKCGELGIAGKKMLFIGFGEEKEVSEDLYGLEGFGMFREADKKINCDFIKADGFPDEDVTHYILNMLDLCYQEDFAGTIEDNIIRFKLDKQYYKYGICINKTPDGRNGVQVEGKDILVTKDGISCGSAADCGVGVTDYRSIIFLCLDQPEPGIYEFKLPELVGNEYSVCFQGYVGEVSLEITLQDGEKQTVRQTGQYGNIIEYTLSNADCTMNLTLEGDPVSMVNIGEGQYTIRGVTGTDNPDSGPLHPKGDELPNFSEEIHFPAETGSEFIVQASLQINGKPIESNLIRVKFELDDNSASYQEISLEVNKKVGIPQSEEERNLPDRNGLTYLVTEMLEDGSCIPCGEDKYKIDDNGSSAQITFKQVGHYCLQTMCYERLLGNPQMYNVTKRPIPAIFLVIGAVSVLVLVLFSALVIGIKKRKN